MRLAAAAPRFLPPTLLLLPTSPRGAAKYQASAKLYGTVASVPDASLIIGSTTTFLDALFTTVGRGAPPPRHARAAAAAH